MAWSGYTSTTKVLVYCPYYQYNPALSTANHSLGLYIKLTTVSTSAFQFNLVTPFGIDNDTRYDSLVVYFNVVQLLADKNIILDVEYLSFGDQLTLKAAMGSTNLFTYTYVTGQGCDMNDNNTFFAL